MGNDTVMLSALAIVASCVGGLIWVIKKMFSEVVPALRSLTASSDQNTKATKSADEYLKQRNGRDNDHHKAVLGGLEAIPTTLQAIADAQAEAIINAVQYSQNIGTQHIKEQHVEKEIVGNHIVDRRKAA